jgi:hypothetical protein
VGIFLSHLGSFKYTPEIDVWTTNYFGHFFHQWEAMSIGGLRVGLVGVGNWSPWKDGIVFILEEGELWDIVESLVAPPTDAFLLHRFMKRNIKAKRNILDVVKYHIIPHVYGKDFTFHMWQSLCSLYQIPNQNQKMVLQEKLRGTKMTKTDWSPHSS